MTPLRQRMAEDMAVRNLSPCTQSSYIQQVLQFARHFGRSPALLGPEQIRDYQVFLATERKLAPGSIGIAVSALRFLYRVTLLEALGHPGGPARPQAAPQAAGRSQSRGSPAVPRLRGAHPAPRHPDHLLRGRPAHLGSRQLAPGRHRQRPHGDPRRAGQGPQGPLRHALAPAAGDPPRLLATHPARGRVAVPGPDARLPSHPLRRQRRLRESPAPVRHSQAHHSPRAAS